MGRVSKVCHSLENTASSSRSDASVGSSGCLQSHPSSLGQGTATSQAELEATQTGAELDLAVRRLRHSEAILSSKH